MLLLWSCSVKTTVLLFALPPELKEFVLFFGRQGVTKDKIPERGNINEVIERSVTERSCLPTCVVGFLAADLGKTTHCRIWVVVGEWKEPILYVMRYQALFPE